MVEVLRMKRSVVTALAATTTLAGYCVVAATPAYAATNIQIVYSTDNGNTWSSSLPVPNPSSWLTRVWYDNSDSAAYRDASVLAHIRSRLVSGTTKVCLSPRTSDPAKPDNSELACNTDAGQTGAINENAVWGGGLPEPGLGTIDGQNWNLRISPTAGLFAEPRDLTKGILERGKKSYLHLQGCTYGNGGTDNFMSFVANLPNAPFRTGTGVSNGPKPLTCGPGDAAYRYKQGSGATQAISLLGKRYFNLQQCVYNSGADLATVAVQQPQTNSSNVKAGPTGACPGTGWAANNSRTQALDLLTLRYVNLQQCVYAKPGDFYTNLVQNSGDGQTRSPATDTGDTPQPANAACAPGYPTSYRWVAANSATQAIDTEDTTRGAGFIEFEAQPEGGPSPYNHSRPVSAWLLIGGAIVAKDSGGWRV
ncbi:hypothetical protein Aple_081000 [Acrocarpospora pleiomorpha]|uniref:Uncharacterized protein n=2 Tax=Acrocarpospora pleiomorpha TaxID=90975 RepID=A0A5M3Y078_9ACTN|nr:hypothetical protein [Acrocarpospora pleiomorpha]GES25201.1 hypothetical protein Aple_081000 [Acrocarpospora pleiomorpha]